MDRHCYLKNEQVFHCYGRTNNKDLLRQYGFCLTENKYNSFKFKVNIDFNWKENLEKEGNQQSKVKKNIKLKENRLRDEVLAYIRANLIH